MGQSASGNNCVRAGFRQRWTWRPKYQVWDRLGKLHVAADLLSVLDVLHLDTNERRPLSRAEVYVTSVGGLHTRDARAGSPACCRGETCLRIGSSSNPGGAILPQLS
jgi:hypothetical protein